MRMAVTPLVLEIAIGLAEVSWSHHLHMCAIIFTYVHIILTCVPPHIQMAYHECDCIWFMCFESVCSWFTACYWLGFCLFTYTKCSLPLVYSTYTVCRHGLPIHNTTVLTHPGPETKVNPIGILIGFLVVYGMSV